MPDPAPSMRSANIPAEKQDSRRLRLLDGPILPTLLSLTLPVIGVIAAQTFVAVLEAYWVSRLGTAAIGGVSLVLPLYILMGTMSNGGIGGGVSSAVSRAIGAGKRDDADALLLHSLVVAVMFGALFSGLAFFGGDTFYRGLGGNGATLDEAVHYSNWAFGSAIVVWLVNLATSALRGAGDVRFPAIVSLAGAALLVPLSPVLILGWGPIPRLGVAGAGIAMLIYYSSALAALSIYIFSGRAPLKLNRRPLQWRYFAAIMGVGGISAIGTIVASLTAVALTAAVGLVGSEAIAGYGIASRLDSLLVPLLFGLGSGVVTLVGAATGAGLHDRARRVADRAALVGFVMLTLFGTVIAFQPNLWMSIFVTDPQVTSVGSDYLRINAPAFGLFGAGLLYYFSSQGRGRMLGPFLASLVRLCVAGAGSYLLVLNGFGLRAAFITALLGTIAFAAVNLVSSRRAFG